MSMRQFAQALVGMVLAATPVALWIAWTPSILGWVALVAVLSAGLLVLLTEPQPEAGRPVRLPEAFVVEAQNLFPFIHHHSPRGSPRFWRAMQRLSRMMQENERGAASR